MKPFTLVVNILGEEVILERIQPDQYNKNVLFANLHDELSNGLQEQIDELYVVASLPWYNSVKFVESYLELLNCLCTMMRLMSGLCAHVCRTSPCKLQLIGHPLLPISNHRNKPSHMKYQQTRETNQDLSNLNFLNRQTPPQNQPPQIDPIAPQPSRPLRVSRVRVFTVG